MTRVIADCFTAECNDRETAVWLAEAFLRECRSFEGATISWDGDTARLLNSEGEYAEESIFLEEMTEGE